MIPLIETLFGLVVLPSPFTAAQPGSNPTQSILCFGSSDVRLGFSGIFFGGYRPTELNITSLSSLYRVFQFLVSLPEMFIIKRMSTHAIIHLPLFRNYV